MCLQGILIIKAHVALPSFNQKMSVDYLFLTTLPLESAELWDDP